MVFDTIDSFRSISVGDSIKIKKRYLPPCRAGLHPVHSIFIQHIECFDNIFTVTILRPLDERNAYISVFEVGQLLEYFQIVPIIRKGGIRVINSYG